MKKIVSICMAVILSLSLASGALASAPAEKTHFVDVPKSHWAFAHIQRAFQDGVVMGIRFDEETGKRWFSPNTTLSIAEFTVILARAFYMDEVEEKVRTQWYNREKETLEAHGIFNGIRDLDMSRKADRFELATMASNVIRDRRGEKELTQAQREKIKASISDWDQIPECCRDAVVTAYAYHILNGTGDGRFDGDMTLTRSQAAAVYCRIADAVNLGEREIMPLLSYLVGRYYVRNGDTVREHHETGMMQYEVDLDSQFYELDSVKVVYLEDRDHTLFLMDGDRKILDEKQIKAGETVIPVTPGLRYIAASAGEDEQVSITASLTDGGMEEREENTIPDNPFSGRSLSVIGDSISSFTGYTPKFPCYPQGDVSKVSQMWWYMLAKDLGMNVCKVNAYSGSGVSDLGDPDRAASAGRGRELDICGQTPDVVFVMIGANDQFKLVDMGTFRSNYVKMLDDIVEAYPEASVYLFTYPHSTLREGNKVIKELAKEYRMGVVDMECEPLLRSQYFIDGVHFNDSGMKLAVEKMETEFLKDKSS